MRFSYRSQINCVQGFHAKKGIFAHFLHLILNKYIKIVLNLFINNLNRKKGKMHSFVTRLLLL